MGWSLLGVGLGLRTLSIIGLSRPHDGKFALVNQVLDHSGTALTATGLAIAPFATGYWLERSLSAPISTTSIWIPGGAGVVMSGRF